MSFRNSLRRWPRLHATPATRDLRPAIRERFGTRSGRGVDREVLVLALLLATGVMLSDLTWPEAEKALKPDSVVVIPLGAAAKEHGPHLKLKNDLLMADALARRVREARNVVIAPTIDYSFYPAFLEYPGSTSLRLETARDMVVDICRSLAKFGPKRFYILNTGISTLRPLAAAAEMLAADGIVMRYTDLHVTEP